MSTEHDNYFEASDLVLDFHGQPVLKQVSLTLARGEVSCLLGQSGSGKSTLLRAIAGFEHPAAGSISLAGRDLLGIDAKDRPVGFVFQDASLFPHLTVLDNVRFGLFRLPSAEQSKVASRWLARVGLEDRGASMPHELSGGERQRVALARALAPEPELVLLDEPFSSLDLGLRRGLARLIRTLFKEQQTTALFVTHDQEEAFLLADNIGVLRDGKLLQWGSAHQIYAYPSTEAVASFVGESFYLEGVVESDTVKTALGAFRLDCESVSESFGESDTVKVLFRQQHVVFDRSANTRCNIVSVEDHGDAYLYRVVFDGGEEGALKSAEVFSQGASVGVRATLDRVLAFPAG